MNQTQPSQPEQNSNNNIYPGSQGLNPQSNRPRTNTTNLVLLIIGLGILAFLIYLLLTAPGVILGYLYVGVIILCPISIGLYFTNRRHKETKFAFKLSIMGLFIVIVSLALFIWTGYSMTIGPVTSTNREPGVLLGGFIAEILLAITFLSGLLLSFVYKNPSEHRGYQTFKLIFVITLFFIGSGTPTTFALLVSQKENQKKVETGEIGGITQAKAIENSKSVLKSGINYKFVQANLNPTYGSGVAVWEVIYDVNNKNGEYVMDLDVPVSAKDGTILPQRDMIEVEFTLLNKGKEAVGWEVMTEWADPQGTDSIVKHWVYDYGITDQSGKVKLDLRNSQQENAYLYIIYNSGEYITFYKINKPFKNSYSINIEDTSIKSL